MQPDGGFDGAGEERLGACRAALLSLLRLGVILMEHSSISVPELRHGGGSWCCVARASTPGALVLGEALLGVPARRCRWPGSGLW